jgi:hypothetical protein
MWLKRLLLTLAAAALLTSTPCPGDAGGPAGRFGMGKAGGFREPSSFLVPPPFLTVAPPFRFPNRSVWYPLIPQSSAAVWMVPPQVVVVPMLVQQVSSEVPAPVPVPDPKFVFPPAQSPPSKPGSHTVIVQHGSQIEVQSFPAAR